MNCVILVGFVGRDPELRSTHTGTQVCKFSVATTAMKKTTWHNVTCFGKTAEFAGQYIKKGSIVEIVGSIDVSQYERDGQKRTAVCVIADRVNFAPSRKPSDTVDAVEQQSEHPADPGDQLPF
jgi:single-strand DNA-binding protein